MSHYIPFTGPIADYIRANYDLLESEFFNTIEPVPRSAKPRYIRNNGKVLYGGKIDIVAIKLARVLLDEHEQRITNWTDADETYRYPFKKRHPGVTINAWDNLLNTFEDSIEQCFFNFMYPPATLSYHYGISKHCWRVHICLQENQGFTFDVGGEKHKWTKGMDNAFMFDDGNLFHGVTYEDVNIEQPRIVFILDIKK
jgi:hypothetical protein